MAHAIDTYSAYISVAASPDSRASLSASLGVRERSIRIAKKPESPATVREKIDTAAVYAETRRQLSMLGRIVERDRLIEMRSRFRDVSGGTPTKYL